MCNGTASAVQSIPTFLGSLELGHGPASLPVRLGAGQATHTHPKTTSFPPVPLAGKVIASWPDAADKAEASIGLKTGDNLSTAYSLDVWGQSRLSAKTAGAWRRQRRRLWCLLTGGRRHICAHSSCSPLINTELGGVQLVCATWQVAA